MRPTFDRRHWILLFIILIQCTTYTQQQNIKPQKSNLRHAQKPAEQTTTTATITTTPSATTTTTTTAATKWSSSITSQMTNVRNSIDDVEEDEIVYRQLKVDNKYRKAQKELQHEDYINDDDDDDDDDGDGDELEVDNNKQQQQRVKEQKCAKNCLTNAQHAIFTTTYSNNNNNNNNQNKNNKPFDVSIYTSAYASPYSTATLTAIPDMPSSTEAERPTQNTQHKTHKKHTNLAKTKHTNRRQWHGGDVGGYQQYKREQMRKVHTAHRQQHREVKEQHKWKRLQTQKQHHQPHHYYHETRLRRDTVEQEQEQLREPTVAFESAQFAVSTVLSDTLETVAPSASSAKLATTTSYANSTGSSSSNNNNSNNKRTRSTTLGGLLTEEAIKEKEAKGEAIIIIDDVEEFDSGTGARHGSVDIMEHSVDADYSQEGPLEPRVLPLRPVLPNPYDNEEMSVVYAEQHSEIKLMCEVDLDIATSMWYKNGQVVHAIDRTTRVTDYRFIKEANGALTITNVMLEDDGKWQCEAENTRRYTENARPVKLVVLDRPKPPYLLIDSRRLDAGNIFVPVKENSELNLACVSEGGNPRPTLTWEVLLSPGVDRHAQKVSAEVLELEEVKSEKDKNSYKINSGAKSEARLPAVYRAHHNARILCVMEHPMLKIRQNASLLLDVQYTPSFAISRTPGFGYPLREGIEVSLKCDVDSNPPSTPRWQKDDGDTPVPQTGDGFLNFTSIRREHSGWYKCTSRHLNFQYSSIGYYLSVRYDSVDVTSEPDDQDVSVAAASHNPNKGQLEVQLGGAVTLQCPQGSLGCWSHLDPVTARLRGLGHGLSTPTGQVSLKDVVYQDAGTYKCIGQSPTNKKKLEVLQSVSVSVKGAPTVIARNATPVAYPGSPLHLAVEFCANPPAHAARWLHGDRVFTPGNQYGSTVLAYGVTDLPTPYCKEARLTYVSMHERVPRTFYFIVSSPGGVAEAIFKVNFTMRYRQMSNAIDDDAEEELSEPEEIHFPVFGNSAASSASSTLSNRFWLGLSVVLCYFWILRQL